VTTVSFDIAVLEIYLPLIVGARVVLASREVATDGIKLRAAIEAHSVTVLQATPTTWRLILAAGLAANGPRLKALCGGEALPIDLADALRPVVTELWNMYGPTETCVWSSCARVDGAAITLGRPIANTYFRVLDIHGQLVPPGVAGELYIGGDGLARGYSRLPELTAERFVPDEHGEPGQRLYRTGDEVRYRGDGTIEYLGRLDHQVKLRGFRIELGEIEATLRAIDGVREGAGARGRAWREAAGRLLHERRGAWRGGPPPRVGANAAGAHASERVCTARGNATEPEWQARSRGAAGAGGPNLPGR
jgi:amino acid adenylation domain-containing protein